MQTIVITSGASGIGGALTKYYTNQGNKVVVIGHSQTSYQKLIDSLGENQKQLISFIQADLSLIKENKRVVNILVDINQPIDKLIFCATKHNRSYTTTSEGIESSFSLDYLSRYILSYRLTTLINQSEDKQIINLCGTGYKGAVNFNDIEHKLNYKPMNVMMHGSRLNELLAVKYSKSNPDINYILINPGPVSTDGMKHFYDSKFKWTLYKLISQSSEQAAINLAKQIDDYKANSLVALSSGKEKDLSKSNKSYNQYQELFDLTQNYL